jgi:replicative DNA helicase
MKPNAKEKKKSLSDYTGKLMPHDIDAERVVIGALLLESSATDRVENLLNPDDFYQKEHEIIYRAVMSLKLQGKKIDLVTVYNELQRQGKAEETGGAYALSQLSSGVTSAAHIEEHAAIVKEKSVQRKLIILAEKIKSMAYDDTFDTDDILSAFEQGVTEVKTDGGNCFSIDLNEAMRIAFEKASDTQRIAQSGGTPFVPSCLPSLNKELWGGWRSPDLIVVGARPSQGKTQHALANALTAARSGKHVLFLSLEMISTQLVNRLLFEDSAINPYHLHTGQMNNEEWRAMDIRAGKLKDTKLYIAAGFNIRQLNNIKSEARRMKRLGKLDMLVIDYLGLIRTNMTFSNRYLEIGYITGDLKNLAKELDIPVMLLSQLNRPIKGATAKEPQLEDLRESGDIEQDADIVLLLHKPDYNNPGAMDASGVPWKNRGKIIIAKHREGVRNNTIIFHHDERYKKIFDEPAVSFSGNPDSSRAPEIFPPVAGNADFLNTDNDNDLPY